MRALIIDPYVLGAEDGRLVISDQPPLREVQYDGNYESIYTMLTSPGKRVTTFDAVGLGSNGDTAYVDDEGMFNATHFFMVEGATYPIAGRGLVLGTDETGESVEPVATVESLWNDVRIGIGNVSVHLSDLLVGDPVTHSAIRIRPEMVMKEWAVELGVWA